MENSFIYELEADHKMEKKLKIAEIAARTGLSASTVSRVLAGKANTSARARELVLACARELGVMDAMAAGRMLLNSLIVFAPPRAFDERSDIFLLPRDSEHQQGALAARGAPALLCAGGERQRPDAIFVPDERAGNAGGDPAWH
ncbi:transcriptional regulator [Citrobacter freundii]|nr:transcriptional regulator [Citrobacter freundii]